MRERDRDDALKAPGLAFASALVSVVFALASGSARAGDKRAEAAARAALDLAVADYAANDFGHALARLRSAASACAGSRCNARVSASLYRDIGALQFVGGDKEKASASFLEALAAVPSLDWNPAYDRPDLRSEWEAAKDEASDLGHPQPSGDFITTPAAEQVVHTAVPVYVEYRATTATVVIAKYKATGMTEPKKIRLSLMGKGWGGSIPCTDVVRGVVRYYVQGFDENDNPVAFTGDPRHPLYVPIRDSIRSPAPHLPGKEPPVQCRPDGECPAGAACDDSHGEPGGPKLDNGEVCEVDGQCTSGRCASGRCASDRSPSATEGGYVRFWFGAAGSIDITVLSGGHDVCLLTSQAKPANSQDYYCTTPSGADFPTRASPVENNTLVKGQAGQAAGGLEPGNVRVLLSFDYAASTHLLLGSRFGLVVNGYPGASVARDGRGFGPPVHLELRGTFLFGDRPLAHSGFAPLVFLSGGLGEFDASVSVRVIVSNVPGSRPMVAWQTGGPGFAALGGGFRYAFSPRVAFSAALKVTTAFGGGFLPTVAPEVGLQYGF